MRIATFNVQNLRLRRPRGRPRLDGARDGDVPQDATPEAMVLDLADRRLTARVIASADPDVLCLQEVFDQATLDFFHDHLLRATGAAPWPWRVCRPGNDGAGRDLAVISRRPVEVFSHAALRPGDLDLPPVPGQRPDRPIFCRDCLRIELPGLTVFNCHFKAPWPEPAPAWHLRHAEAQAVRSLIARRFGRPADAPWLVVGDLNEPEVTGPNSALSPLLEGFSVDLTARMPPAKRWSWAAPDGSVVSGPDAILASPSLARRFAGRAPQAVRQGMGHEVQAHGGDRLEGVGRHRPHASDHALVFMDFPDL